MNQFEEKEIVFNTIKQLIRDSYDIKVLTNDIKVLLEYKDKAIDAYNELIETYKNLSRRIRRTYKNRAETALSLILITLRYLGCRHDIPTEKFQNIPKENISNPKILDEIRESIARAREAPNIEVKTYISSSSESETEETNEAASLVNINNTTQEINIKAQNWPRYQLPYNHK